MGSADLWDIEDAFAKLLYDKTGLRFQVRAVGGEMSCWFDPEAQDPVLSGGAVAEFCDQWRVARSLRAAASTREGAAGPSSDRAA